MSHREKVLSVLHIWALTKQPLPWVITTNFSIEPTDSFSSWVPKILLQQKSWCPACKSTLIAFQVLLPLWYSACFSGFKHKQKQRLSSSHDCLSLKCLGNVCEAVLNHSLTGARFVESKAFDLWFESVFIHSLFLNTVWFLRTVSPCSYCRDVVACNCLQTRKGILQFAKRQEGSQAAVSWHLAGLANRDTHVSLCLGHLAQLIMCTNLC